MSNIRAVHRLIVSLVLVLVPTQALAFSLLPSEIPATDFHAWQMMIGDSIIIDTRANIGYFVHAYGGFTQFVVATGQKRVVRYIGRTYNAKTPDQSWAVLNKETKGDRTTFGKYGLFLRLYDADGETPYGIHSHRSAGEMLASSMRFRSMGCIIVSQAVLDVIEAMYEANGRRIDVETVDGLGEGIVTYQTLQEKLAAR